ncbi:MAG: dihydropteroate synthase [Bacteroidales bacterium]|nr:dihydropteroate synthase [Bacteroidales bacterium]
MKPFTLNLCGRLTEITRTQVMGILNVTPDSFYAGSHSHGESEARRRVETMIAEGADMIDVGGYSSRPGAAEVDIEEEMRRVRIGVEAVRAADSNIPVSVDTFRAEVARRAVEEWGADIVNDISGGTLDKEMFATVAAMRVPYILMHMRGTPRTMQTLTDYSDVTADVATELSRPLERLRRMGVADIIVDPGFGFSKTLTQNYALMGHLANLGDMLGCPLLVGISRKSMISRLCDITTEETLPGTIALNTAAMLAGAAILRVHDVAATVQAAKVTDTIIKNM